jgi:hypothetical protein
MAKTKTIFHVHIKYIWHNWICAKRKTGNCSCLKQFSMCISKYIWHNWICAKRKTGNCSGVKQLTMCISKYIGHNWICAKRKTGNCSGVKQLTMCISKYIWHNWICTKRKTGKCSGLKHEQKGSSNNWSFFPTMFCIYMNIHNTDKFSKILFIFWLK